MKLKVLKVLGVLLCTLLVCNEVTLFTEAAQKKTVQGVEEALNFRPTIESAYEVEFYKASDIYLRNNDITDSGVVYMEYEVTDIESVNTTAAGLYAMSVPLIYPKPETGFGEIHSVTKTLKKDEENPMLILGAKYYICFAVTQDDDLETFVQRTYKGKSENIVFPEAVGEWKDIFKYFNLYLGGGEITCKLSNFKCYDANGTDLGIQVGAFNEHSTKISTVGELRDDSLCEGTYYCKDKPELGLLVLGENNCGYRESNGQKENFSYNVYGNAQEKASLYLTFPEGKETYAYQYLQMTDENGNCYKRLKNSKVTFVIDDEVIVEKATEKNSFRVQAPSVSEKDGKAFEGWFLGDGEKYDLNGVVTESITLYAKWEGDKIEYLEVMKNLLDGKLLPLIVVTLGAVVILGGSIVGSVLILRRKPKNGDKQNKTKL